MIGPLTVYAAAFQFPMLMPEVVLSGIVYDADAEILSYDSTLLPQGVTVTRTAAG